MLRFTRRLDRQRLFGAPLSSSSSTPNSRWLCRGGGGGSSSYGAFSSSSQSSSPPLLTSPQHAPRLHNFLLVDNEDDHAHWTSKERHERAVAQAQTTARLRRKQQQMEAKDDPRPNNKMLAREEAECRHQIANSIQHWISKDKDFFDATMSSLNLNTQWSQQQQQQQQQQSSNNKQGVPVELQLASEAEDENDEASIAAIFNQYRHLYFDSILSFRQELETNNNSATVQVPLSTTLKDAMQKLQNVGFGDANFGKRYRQVKGYRFQQENIDRKLVKARLELSNSQKTLRIAQVDVAELEREFQTRADRLEEKKKKKRSREKKPLLVEAKQHPESSEEEEPSVFSKALAVVSSLWTPTITTTTTNPSAEAKDSSTQYENNSWSLDNESNGNDIFPTSRKENRLERRLQKRIKFSQKTQQEVHQLHQRVLELELEQLDFKLPISQDEYHRATQVVHEIRPQVCQELASHIQQRHKLLIVQYQTLDAKTGKKVLDRFLSVAFKQ
jgi:hypothetical protein